MKKLLWIGLAVALVGVILYSNIQQQKTTTDKKTVLVILPMTGNAAVWGDLFSKGVEYFKDTHPKSKIDIKLIDSQTNPSYTISALKQTALQEKIYAIVSTTSLVTVPVAKFAKDLGIFTIGCVMSDKILEQDNIQRIYPSAYDSTIPVLNYAKKNFNRLAVLYGNEEGGLSAYSVMKKYYPDKDHQIIFTDSYEVNGTADTHTLIKKVLQAKPDAIFISGHGSMYWGIIRELKSIQFNGGILTDLFFANPTQLKELGKSAEGIIFTASETDLTESDRPQVKSAKEFYLKHYNQIPNYTGITVYEALDILNYLAENNIPVDNKVFQKLGKYEGVGGTLKFIEGGDVYYPWIAVTIKNGEIIPVESETK